jgi:predicted ATPase/GAF domain-containing protein
MPVLSRGSSPSIKHSELIKRDALFQLQRVTSVGGNRFLVKFPVSERPGPEHLLLEHEFGVFETLASEHVLAPLRLDASGAHYEDCDGVPLLASSSGSAPGAAEIGPILRQLCALLSLIHEHDWILVGMTPGSFLWEPATARLILTDAPFARRVRSPIAGREEAMVGTPHLAYAAPEVVGRTPVIIDQRADLYSLGANLYHLLCGRPPFEASDPAEIVHCHLAKEPPPLETTSGGAVPKRLAELVHKLLAKSPSDRFESVAAFEDEFLLELETVVGAGVRPGRSTFQSGPVPAPRLSPKLFGVDAAVGALNEKLTRTRSAAAVTFLEGDAGLGKTSLLMHSRSLLKHGYFCRGGFRPSTPSAPLSGWASALKDLADVVLTKAAAEVERWRRAILAKLGDSAALIGNFVAEWGAILGIAPRAADAIVEGAVNRLAVAIHLLLRCFATPDTPVVVALDDLQWADGSSLRILELVAALPEPINLLVLCGVRPAPHPTPTTARIEALRGALEASSVPTDTIHLHPWEKDAILAFLRDSFGAELSNEEAFADFLQIRTKGNPLFVRELVRATIHQRLLDQDDGGKRSSFRPAALQALPPADTVVQFLTERISGLTPELKEALQIGACLGATFRLADFATVVSVPLEDAARRLLPAVVEGLLLMGPGAAGADGEGVSEATSFEFAHDRVFEACRSTLDDAERQSLALTIGRRLLAASAREGRSGAAHRLAGYFNVARARIDDPVESRSLARLNLEAGVFAKQSGAFSQALEYLQAGLAFLETANGRTTEDAWTLHAELALPLFEAAAEAALLNGHLDLTHRLCDVILAHTASPLERARCYEIRVCALNAEKRFPDAVRAACEILGELRVRFPRRPRLLHTIVAFLGTRRRLLRAPVERLATLDANDAPEAKAAFRIMQAMYSSAYFGEPKLFPLLVCRHIDASLTFGNDDYSCVTYVAFAIVLCARGDFSNASRLATVALELQRRPGAEMHIAKVYLGRYAFVMPWTQHLRDSIPHLVEGTKAGIQLGDFEYAAHLITTHSLARLHCGSSLAELAPEFEQQCTKVASLGQERSIILERLFCQIVHDLRDGPSGEAPLGGPHYAESEMLPRCIQPIDENLAFHHFLAKMIICLFHGQRTSALEAATRAREFFEGGAFGIYLGAIFTFWESLLWVWSARGGEVRASTALRRAARGIRQLKRWARAAPMNFLNKLHLLEAERARTMGRSDVAATHYERAIELSQAHGYVHDAALAHECAAAFYLERGMDRLARRYLRDAFSAYERWGATAVARRLQLAYPQHFAAFVSNAEDPVASARVNFAEDLDYRALLTASQALAGEILLPKLLRRLLGTMFEHAGAQRALLVLERRGHLEVVAEADVDRGDAVLPRKERVDESARLCRSVVRYSAATGRPVVLADAVEDERFAHDPYMQQHRPRSVLCVPMVHQGKLLGLAYLENNRVTHVFTAARVEIAGLLAAQGAISVAGARLHALELEAQQAKINPHFLFNALSSIADLAVEDGQRAEDALVKLAHLYRYILTSGQDTPVTLDQEFEVVRSYLELEKLRLGSKLDYTVRCEDGVSQVRVPGLLIQPLVENAIRHGISPKLSPGTVQVLATKVGQRCQIVVHDDGDGSPSSTGGTGFGLRSVQERLGLVFGRDYGIAITRNDGYRVEVEVPLDGPIADAPSGSFDVAVR